MSADPIHNKNHRWDRLRDVAPRSEHYLHLAYFGLVAIHGPYHHAAAVCFVVGVIIALVTRRNH